MSTISFNDIKQITSIPKIEPPEKPQLPPEIITIKQIITEACKRTEPEKPDCNITVQPIIDWENVDLEKFAGANTIEELESLLKELVARFDTSPRNLTKTDYDHLMRVLCAALLHLYTTSAWGSVNLTSSNEDVLTIEKNGDGAEWQPHVGNLAVETTNHESMNQQNEKQLATVGNIRDYINNRLSWIEPNK